MAVTLSWVVYANGTGTPTGVQIRNGQNALGNPAYAAGTEAYSTPGVYDEATAITNLTPSSAYQVAWVAWDGVGYSNVAESAAINTISGTVYADSRAESVALTDSQAVAAVTYVVARAESVALADSQSAGPSTYVASRAESIALSDSTTGAIASGGCDPYFNQVVLLQHFDNSLLATVGGQFSVDGTVTMSQTNARWDYSVNINGAPTPPGTSGANVVWSNTSSATWNLNATDFTIEGWLWLNSVPDRPRTLISIVDTGNTGDEYGIIVDGYPAPSYQFLYPIDANNTATIVGTPIQLNTWVFLSYRRTGNLYEASINGVPLTSENVSNAYRRPAGARIVLEGNSHRGFVDALDGIIDDVRVTTVARPINVLPTGPFPDIQCAAPITGTVPETLSLNDSQNAVVVSGGPSTVQETLNLSASQNAVVVAAGINSVIESFTLNATQTAAAIYGVTCPESFSLSDVYNVQSVTYTVARAESIALSDSQTGTLPTTLTGTVNESFSLNAQQDAYIGVLPVSKIGHFGEPKKEGIKEAERTMIQLEDEFILEIVLSLAIKGAIA